MRAVVRVFDMESGALLTEVTRSQPVPTDGPLEATFHLHQLLAVPEVAGHQTVRVEIEAPTPDDALVWAMLTLTDLTQHVTVMTSQ